MICNTLLSHQVQQAGAYGESILFVLLTVRSFSWWFVRIAHQEKVFRAEIGTTALFTSFPA